MTEQNELRILLDHESEGLNTALNSAYISKDAPAAVHAMHAYFHGDRNRLQFHFEQAHGLIPDLPIQFAEGLFRLKNDNGQIIRSDIALQSVEGCDQQDHVASRMQFWLLVANTQRFFQEHPNHTHLSLNVSATACASPYFTKRMVKLVDALHTVHPDKNLILEMLEHQPWRKAQEKTMLQLSKMGVRWAVDDYGAPRDGCHDITSLRLVRKHSKPHLPIVKIDGGLIEKSLQTQDMRTLISRLQEVNNRGRSDALLVLEWVKNAGQIAVLREAMNSHGLQNMDIHYAQGQDFTAAEAQKVIGTPALTA